MPSDQLTQLIENKEAYVKAIADQTRLRNTISLITDSEMSRKDREKRMTAVDSRIAVYKEALGNIENQISTQK